MIGAGSMETKAKFEKTDICFKACASKSGCSFANHFDQMAQCQFFPIVCPRIEAGGLNVIAGFIASAASPFLICSA